MASGDVLVPESTIDYKGNRYTSYLSSKRPLPGHPTIPPEARVVRGGLNAPTGEVPDWLKPAPTEAPPPERVPLPEPAASAATAEAPAFSQAELLGMLERQIDRQAMGNSTVDPRLTDPGLLVGGLTDKVANPTQALADLKAIISSKEEAGQEIEPELKTFVADLTTALEPKIPAPAAPQPSPAPEAVAPTVDERIKSATDKLEGLKGTVVATGQIYDEALGRAEPVPSQKFEDPTPPLAPEAPAAPKPALTPRDLLTKLDQQLEEIDASKKPQEVARIFDLQQVLGDKTPANPKQALADLKDLIASNAEDHDVSQLQTLANRLGGQLLAQGTIERAEARARLKAKPPAEAQPVASTPSAVDPKEKTAAVLGRAERFLGRKKAQEEPKPAAKTFDTDALLKAARDNSDVAAPAPTPSPEASAWMEKYNAATESLGKPKPETADSGASLASELLDQAKQRMENAQDVARYLTTREADDPNRVAGFLEQVLKENKDPKRASGLVREIELLKERAAAAEKAAAIRTADTEAATESYSTALTSAWTGEIKPLVEAVQILTRNKVKVSAVKPIAAEMSQGIDKALATSVNTAATALEQTQSPLGARYRALGEYLNDPNKDVSDPKQTRQALTELVAYHEAHTDLPVPTSFLDHLKKRLGELDKKYPPVV